MSKICQKWKNEYFSYSMYINSLDKSKLLFIYWLKENLEKIKRFLYSKRMFIFKVYFLNDNKIKICAKNQKWYNIRISYYNEYRKLWLKDLLEIDNSCRI